MEPENLTPAYSLNLMKPQEKFRKIKSKSQKFNNNESKLWLLEDGKI